MTNITNRVDLSNVHAISGTLKAIPLSEAPEELFQQIMQAKQDMLEMDYTHLPSTSNNPTYADYATIEVKGKVVAHIDNHGWLITSNAMGKAFDKAIKEADSKVNPISGPSLAKVRAETIAQYLGGTVVMAPTALSQSAYNAHEQPKAVVDYAAMKKDPRYDELERLRQVRAVFLAEQAS